MRRVLPLVGGIILGVGLGIILIFGFLKSDDFSGIGDFFRDVESPLAPSVDAPAPGFELVSLSGEPIQLSDYRGQTVLLNFWATWCGPCRLEMPAFQSQAEKYSGELAVVAVNNAEDPADVQAFVDELDLSFDILLDTDAEVQHLYQVSGYPTTFLIDSEGVIRIQKIGILTEEELDGYLQKLGVGK